MGWLVRELLLEGAGEAWEPDGLSYPMISWVTHQSFLFDQGSNTPAK